jgi:hypothetical protein
MHGQQNIKKKIHLLFSYRKNLAANLTGQNAPAGNEARARLVTKSHFILVHFETVFELKSELVIKTL